MRKQKFLSLLMLVLMLFSTMLNPITTFADDRNVDESEWSELSDAEVIENDEDKNEEETQEELSTDDEEEAKLEEKEPVKNKGDPSERKEIEEQSKEKEIDEKDKQQGEESELDEKEKQEQNDEKEVYLNEDVVDEKDSKSNEKESYSPNQVSRDLAKKPVDDITLTPNKEPMSRGGIGKVDISWSITDGSYAPGDLFKIQLPDDLSPPSKSIGDEYLQCSVVGNELFCVFTDAVDGKVNVSGELWYETMYLPSETSDSEDPKETEKDFEFSSEGEIFSNPINVILPTDGSGTPGQHKTHRDIEKWATGVTWEYGEDGSKVLTWQVEVNGNLTENLGETIYKDTLGVGHEVIPDSIKVSVVHSEDGPTGTDIVPAPYEGPEPTIEVAEDHTSFTVTFADNTLSGYRADILYETKITNENVGKWVNNGNVDNDKYNSGKTAEYLNTDSGAQDRAENPDPSTIKFLKVEEDANGPGIAGVEFNIYKSDGEFVAKSLHPTDHNGNAEVWTESNGNKLEPGTYYATEILGEANKDYDVDENLRHYFVITENEGTVLTIINEKKEKVKTSIRVNKKWENDTDNDRPESIEVQLYQNDESYGEKITLTESVGWTHTYNGLPKYDENGELYKYTVKEVDVPEGYTSKVDGTTITNTLTPKTYAVGDYTWIDSNKDGIQDEDEEVLEGVKVELFDKDGNKLAETETDQNGLYIFDELESGDYKIKFTLTEEQAKKYEFTKQNAGDDTTVDSDADKDGWTIEFTLDDENENLTTDYLDQEVKASEGIDPTWDAGVVEKEPLTPIEPAKTAVDVEKIWEGKKQEKVTINLLADGEKIDEVELSDANDWKHTFTDLPTVHDVTDEKAIEYTVEEVEIDGYNSEVTGDAQKGFTVTNTEIFPQVPIIPGKTSVDVEKIWEGKKQEKVTINLLADGEKIDEVELSDANDWKHTFTDLPVVNDVTDETVIAYTVEEVEIAGYNVTITGDAKIGFTVTNTEIVPTPEDPKEPEKPEKPEKPKEEPKEEPKDPVVENGIDKSDGEKLPKTATNIYSLLLIGFILILIGIGVAVYRGRVNSN